MTIDRVERVPGICIDGVDVGVVGEDGCAGSTAQPETGPAGSCEDEPANRSRAMTGRLTPRSLSIR